MRAAWPLLLALVLGAAAPSAAGVVLAPDGAPVSGAAVTLYAAESHIQRAERLAAGRARAPLASAVTGADGGFRFAPTGGPAEVAVLASGFAPAFADASDPRLVVGLRKAASRRGVITAQGGPVAGARVVFLASDDVEREWAVRTAADGSYEAPDPAQWARHLLVFHPDFAPCAHDSDWGPGTRDLDCALEPGVPLSGRVVDERGQPVAGAGIWVRDGYAPWPLATSAADGTFHVAHAPSGWTLVLARGDALVGRAERQAGPLTVVARPARTVTGTVRDAAGGAALPGARVTFTSGGVSNGAVTDAQGRYALAGVAVGEHTFQVARTGYGYASPSTDGAPAVIRVPAAGPVSHDFRLVRRPSVTARVEDEAHRPLAGALVTFGVQGAPHIYAPDVYRALGMGDASTVTGPDGVFTLGMPAWGDAGRPLVILKHGFAAGRLELKAPPAPSAPPLVVTLSRGVALRGRTVDADGAPVAGAMVALAEDGTFPGTSASIALVLAGVSGEGWVTSGADGTFSVHVHPGPHHVRAQKGGFVPRQVRGRDPGQELLEIVMQPAAALRGRVTRADGSGVAEATVALSTDRPLVQDPPHGATTADGSFSIQDLVPGPYTLQVWVEALGVVETLPVEVPGPPVLVRFGPTGTLGGRVIDAATRRPLPRFVLSLSWEDGQRTVPVEDAGGQFTVPDLPAGPLALAVNADGHAAKTVDDLAVTAGEVAPAVEVALEAEVVVRGRVTDVARAPVSGVRIKTSLGRGGEASSEGVTDGEGRFEVRGQAAGELTLEFQASGFVSEKRVVDTRQAAASVEVTLQRGLSLTGRVLAEGAPAPRATVIAWSSDGQSQGGPADDNGRFRLDGLTPGRYTVQASGAQGHATLEDVDPQAAGHLQLVLVMPRTAVLAGRLSGVTVSEEALSMVQAVGHEEGRTMEAAVDASTLAFRMAEAPAGPVSVQARVMDAVGHMRASRPLDLVLAPGSETDVVLEFPAGSVSGQVTRDGAPVPGVMVAFSSGRSMGPSARTDAAGRYQVNGIDPGPYTVVVAGDGHTFFSTEHTVGGSDELDIDVTGASVQGRVVRADGGEPVGGVEVAFWPLFGGRQNTAAQNATSNEQGEFSVRALHEGRYRLTTSKAGFGQQVRELDLQRGAAGPVSIELAPAGGITVTVVDQRSGRALEAVVVVRDAQRRIVANRHSGLGDDGALNIPLADGAYILSTSANGFGTATRPVTAPSSGLRIALTPGGTLVIDSTRLVQGRVRLLQADGEEYVRCWCNGIADIALTGRRTTVDHVASGSYTMEVLAGAEVLARQPVVIREGQKSTVVID
jgi:hypothetical protein